MGLYVEPLFWLGVFSFMWGVVFFLIWLIGKVGEPYSWFDVHASKLENIRNYEDYVRDGGRGSFFQKYFIAGRSSFTEKSIDKVEEKKGVE